MYQEKRPTCVTVIGWAWVVIGGLMVLSPIMAIVNLAAFGALQRSGPDTPLMLRVLPFLMVIQIAVGTLGLAAGVNFLKLKPWSRPVLEVLTWLLLLYVIGFTVFSIFHWISLAEGPDAFALAGAITGIVAGGGIYGVPLGIMLKYLRGPKVKEALHAPA